VPARHAPHAQAEPAPLAPRQGPQKVAPTPEQIAKIVTAKLKSPVGMPDKAELALRVVLPRAVIERLMARALMKYAAAPASWPVACRDPVRDCSG
jgi:hypothetical protein